MYGPVETLRYDGPAPVSAAVGWYLDLWMPEGWNEPFGCGLGLPVGAMSDESGDGLSAGGSE